MRNGQHPLIFKLLDAGSGVAGVRVPAPMAPAKLPPVGITPFGRTDSDIKGPGIPKPLSFLRGRLHSLFRPRTMPLPARYLKIFGVTKNSAGAVLAGCTVKLYETPTDRYVETTTSDESGNYEFRSASLTMTYYVVAYKAGSPDVAGVTVNSLIGV